MKKTGKACKALKLRDILGGILPRLFPRCLYCGIVIAVKVCIKTSCRVYIDQLLSFVGGGHENINC